MNKIQKLITQTISLAKAYENPAFGIINVNKSPLGGGIGYPQNIPHVENNAHRPSNYMLPLQIERLVVDITTLNLGFSEAENAWYPHRFRLQQIFIQMIREGHTLSCIEKRKRLTLQKDFCIGKKNADGQWIENKEATKIFNKKWFKTLVGYGLDAQFYGYSLIQLGDLIIKGKDYNFKNLTVLKRWNISPDRHQFVQIPYQTWGLSIDKKEFFTEVSAKRHDKQYGIDVYNEDVDDRGEKFDDWWVYIDTPSDIGASVCGYGLLATVAMYSIILKSNLKWNANFNQMNVAPYRHAQTDHDFDSDEYKRLAQALSQMGNSGYLLTNKDDVLNFINGNTGPLWQSFGDLEKRCQAMISKLIGGHANFMDAQATALGGGSGGKKVAEEDTTPEGKAQLMIEKEQDSFCLNFLNDVCYPKFQKLGFPLKNGECFYLPNDKEKMEVRKRKDEADQVTANIFKTIKEAGGKPDWNYFSERTGITTEEAPEPTPSSFGVNQERAKNIQARLKVMYQGKK